MTSGLCLQEGSLYDERSFFFAKLFKIIEIRIISLQFLEVEKFSIKYFGFARFKDH